MKIEELYEKFVTTLGACTDTRAITPNSMYFALKGEAFDGNSFAEEALQKGASFAVIDNPAVKISDKMILVEDVLSSLQELAKFHRNQLKTLVIGITGSNGKTTTKELIRSVLSERFDVVATKGNLNNHIGVPLTLLSIRPETDIAIVEMGANHPNEISFLCEIAQPDYGYITSIGKAHLEGFGSFEGVIKTKSELYDYLKKNNKTIIFSGNDNLQRNLLMNYENLYSFGNQEDSNVFIELLGTNPVEVSVKETSIVETTFGEKNDFISAKIEGFENQEVTIKSALVGAYNFANISAAITFGRFFKIDLRTIKRGVEKYIPQNNRSQIVEYQSNTFLLDAYNANPSSMSEAIKNMVSMKNFPKKILIIGDMFELGEFAFEEHQNIVNQIESHDWEAVFLVGKHFYETTSRYPKYATFEAFYDDYLKCSFSDSLILVKGSRGMALERLLQSKK